MQHFTSFRVGDIVKFKEDYYLLLEFKRNTEDGWDLFSAIYLNTGKIDWWAFSEQAFTKVA